ncbi:MAG: glycosyltransferase family 4 protein [Solirubrobacterales bacterium]
MARILLVTRPDEGGAFRHVRDLARGLAGAGQEVAVCGPLAHSQDELGVPVIPVAMAREISATRDLASLRGVIGAWRAFGPDLVHAHGSKGSVYARAARVARPSVPVIYTPHGYPFAAYFGSDARRARYRRIERSLSRLAARVICVCEAERELACSVGPCDRTRVVHNGTPAAPEPEPQPELSGLRAEGRPIVSTLSGLRPGKGIETLIEAWPAVLASHPRAVLAIAGDGPERSALQALVARSGTRDSIRLLGHLSPSAVLSSSDLFTLASWAESLPYAVLEAMAFGLPIAATAVGGVGEAIPDGIAGCLVPPRDPRALGAAISDLLGDPAEMARLGEAARRRHAEGFTLAAMIQGILSVYRELIQT